MEPVAAHDLFVALLAGASVLVGGMTYAFLFGMSRVYRIPMLMPFAYLGYGMLAVAALTLSDVLHFTGPWQITTVVILVGYLLAPHGIWHLCLGLHGADEREDGA
jgi:apolipoprotein N-acyltransferase